MTWFIFHCCVYKKTLCRQMKDSHKNAVREHTIAWQQWRSTDVMWVAHKYARNILWYLLTVVFAVSLGGGKDCWQVNWLFVDAKHLLNPAQLSAATFARVSLLCNADDAGWQVTKTVQLMSYLFGSESSCLQVLVLLYDVSLLVWTEGTKLL